MGLYLYIGSYTREGRAGTVALVPPLLASATGTVSVRTVKLVAPAQMDEIAAQTKAFAFRGAGH
jgi:hypothetical protein